MRIAVRALCRDGDTRDAAAGQEKFPLLREQRIAVVHQELRSAKKSIFRIKNITYDLDHPCFVGSDTNASDVNDARFQLDDEEQHVPDGAESAERFHAEEVAGVKSGPWLLRKADHGDDELDGGRKHGWRSESRA